jgi:hypothetical protein
VSARVLYFTRCGGAIVNLLDARYMFRAIDLARVSYPDQPTYVCDSWRSPVVKRETVASDTRTSSRYMGGRCESCGELHAAERIIERGATPSFHRCDARCLYARGTQCECACGGKWHGVGDFTPGQALLFGAGSTEANLPPNGNGVAA